MTMTEFGAPAEITNPAITRGCACYWHRRVFTHVRLGGIRLFSKRRRDGDNRMPLARHVERAQDGTTICWKMRMAIEGAELRAMRLVGATDEGMHVAFSAAIDTGDDGQLLVADNDHSMRTKQGGDPTLIWRLPEQIGRLRFPPESILVIWPEAWWWHLNPDGLTDCLSAIEDTGAVGHTNHAGWSLPAPGIPVGIGEDDSRPLGHEEAS